MDHLLSREKLSAFGDNNLRSIILFNRMAVFIRMAIPSKGRHYVNTLQDMEEVSVTILPLNNQRKTSCQKQDVFFAYHKTD